MSENAVYLMVPKDIFKIGYSVKMSAESDDTAEVMLYGEIVGDVPSYWNYFYPEDKNASIFKKAIEDVRKDGATKLLLRINSPGGVCTEAVAMRSILANAGFDEINIRIEGLCASAATMIASIPGAHVAIAEGSEYMIHNPWCMAYGNANEMEHTIERLRNIEQNTRNFYMTKTGQPEEKIKGWMDEEKWFTAEQAVEYGFADEVLKAEKSTETPIAACVSDREMAAMKSLYKTVPGNIQVEENVPENGIEKLTEPTNNVSNSTPSGGLPENKITNKEENPMEPKDMTLEQLKEGNPDLFAQIRQSAIDSERARLDDIDALTVPGYEEMAAQAKADGTSAMEFQKQLVAAMKEKGNTFIQNRQKETAPAQNVGGGTPASSAAEEEKEIQDNAKEIAEFAKMYSGDSTSKMF